MHKAPSPTRSGRASIPPCDCKDIQKRQYCLRPHRITILSWSCAQWKQVRALACPAKQIILVVMQFNSAVSSKSSVGFWARKMSSAGLIHRTLRERSCCYFTVSYLPLFGNQHRLRTSVRRWDITYATKEDFRHLWHQPQLLPEHFKVSIHPSHSFASCFPCYRSLLCRCFPSLVCRVPLPSWQLADGLFPAAIPPVHRPNIARFRRRVSLVSATQTSV